MKILKMYKKHKKELHDKKLKSYKKAIKKEEFNIKKFMIKYEIPDHYTVYNVMMDLYLKNPNTKLNKKFANKIIKQIWLELLK